ncbi:histidinol-phosphate transaminase [Eubacteriales bacterium OttesenSCG-928-K08]|nr:histidinol-phosphate transaminase [Eubacteriales bacterium OttesenSCG-928-K08]
MSRFLSPRFSAMEPYVPGEQPKEREFIKLNTNESPFAPAPGVALALNSERISKLNLYPDPVAKEATLLIAEYFGLKPDQVLLGNGSDEILAFAFQAFCDVRRPASFADITYGLYSVLSGLYSLPTRVAPLMQDLSLEPDYYYATEATVFLANPNAPTGLALTLEQIEQILKRNPNNVVVVDEAYVDFGAQSAVSLINSYENLLVVQTMSKSRNLAGARLGYALGNAELISDLNKMKFSFNPYNVNSLSLLAAAEAIKDESYFKRCTDEIIRVREITRSALLERGFELTNSKANFLFAKPPKLGGGEYYQKLRQLGVLVRHFDKERISDYVRITIGTQEQMEALLEKTDRILEGL